MKRLTIESIIGAERKGECKILWNRIDNLNLEFSVEGFGNLVTILKVIIKHLDLKEFTYERIYPYKINRSRPYENADKQHIFTMEWVHFNGCVQSQEIIRTDNKMRLVDGSYKVFIPDMLELARDRDFVELDGNTYKVVEQKLSGACNQYEPIMKIDKSVFRVGGYQIPNSFDTKFEHRFNQSHFAKGNYLYSIGDYENAITQYEKEIDSDSVNKQECYFNIGTSLIKLEKYHTAIPLFQQALGMGVESKYLYNLGYCYAQITNKDKALICFKKSLILNPDDKDCIKAIRILNSIK
ncbi:MAG: tetratricopeptide repeat protein [Clostridium sp.]|uniref:tetratricopeptide repeat protein n=1 Tax=Clostridium sp. TaxID=1506 RepID=UPI003F3E0AF8